MQPDVAVERVWANAYTIPTDLPEADGTASWTSTMQVAGRNRQSVPIYGSGGFTSYDERQLGRQLADSVETEGCRWVKMKVGSHPDEDPARVAAAKSAIGAAGLFVDANGAHADDLSGLRAIREHAPDGMEVAAGEYGYTLDYFRRMLEARAVDVLQAQLGNIRPDASRPGLGLAPKEAAAARFAVAAQQ